MSLLRDLTDNEKTMLAPLRSAAKVDRHQPAADIEIRAPKDGDHFANFYGHASVTDKGYDMYGGPSKGGWVEYVDAGAFKKTLKEKPDVAFLANHTGLTLARTTTGNLSLAEDDIGLETEARLNTRVSAVNDVVLLMESGELNEMSFAFRIMKQTWLDAEGAEVEWWDLAGIERHIKEVSINKGDVSIVNYGASPHTDAALRALLDTQEQIRAAAIDDRPPVVLHSSYVDLAYELDGKSRNI